MFLSDYTHVSCHPSCQALQVYPVLCAAHAQGSLAIAPNFLEIVHNTVFTVSIHNVITNKFQAQACGGGTCVCTPCTADKKEGTSRGSPHQRTCRSWSKPLKHSLQTGCLPCLAPTALWGPCQLQQTIQPGDGATLDHVPTWHTLVHFACRQRFSKLMNHACPRALVPSSSFSSHSIQNPCSQPAHLAIGKTQVCYGRQATSLSSHV